LESTFKYYDTSPRAAEPVPAEELDFSLARPTGERSSLLFSASGGTIFTAKQINLPFFSLGGPFRFGAYRPNELLTNQYFLFQGAYLYRLGDISPLLGHSVYLLSGYELGKAYGQPAGVSKLPQDGTLGVLMKTLFGPVFFGGSIGDSGHRRFYFKVGRYF